MATGTYEREREALQAILASPEISRSPNLSRILSYLCEKYFAGESAQVKEYHIALEALGRQADFDQKKDSIVRVEMHRLRRRLRQYYDRTGVVDRLRLDFPEKSYMPVFIESNALPPPEVPLSISAHLPEEAGQTAVAQTAVGQTLEITAVPRELPIAPLPARINPRLLLGVGICGSLLVAFLLIRFWPTPTPARADVAPSSLAVSPENASNAPTMPMGDEIRILCGRQPGLYVDRFGQTWDGDRYFKGGEAVQVQTAVIAGGIDRNIFHGMRVGHQSYHIPLKPGIYQIEMLFAETEYGDGNPLEGGELSRPFHVLVNGKTEIDEVDVIAETVEPNVATSRIIIDASPASDGMLHIELLANSTGEPFVNAIIIRPGIPHKALPQRIICRTHRYRDSKGRVWEPDHYYRGGSSIIRPTTPSVPDGEVFRGERYGKFTYSIPAIFGAKYQASLYIWESWLGPGRPGGGGAGTRVFSVFCNSLPLLRHYDLIADSGPDQVRVKTFRNLEPDRNGKLVFQFDAEANKALLNAIEVIDQSLVP